MKEKNNNELKDELNEEMSLEDLQETSGGRTKGHCGFTNEAGHCGFTCESDDSYYLGIGNPIHCPECWSTSLDLSFDTSPEHETPEGQPIIVAGQSVGAVCKDCGNSWTATAHY